MAATEFLALKIFLYFTVFYSVSSIKSQHLKSARSVRQVMDQVFSFLLWPKHEAHRPRKQGREK